MSRICAQRSFDSSDWEVSAGRTSWCSIFHCSFCSDSGVSPSLSSICRTSVSSPACCVCSARQVTVTYRAITLSMCIDAHMVACGIVHSCCHMSSSARAGSVSSGHAGAGCWLPVAGMDTKSAALPVFARWRCRLLCGLMGLANVVSLSVSKSRTHQQLWLVHPEPAKALVVAWAVAGTSRAVLLLPAVSLLYGREHKAIADCPCHRSRRSGG